MRHWDVVLIGSGISSLTCAALLAKRGKSVCVLEQHTVPGGYLHCFKRGGQRFDTGAHYVGAMAQGQPFRVLLEYLGVYDDSLFTPLDPDGFDVFSLPGLTVSLPAGYEQVISRLSDLFPEDRAGIRAFFTQVRETVRHFPTYEFDDKMDLGPMLSAMETSLWSVVSSLTSNPTLQTLLCVYCTLHGVQPSDVAFGMHSIVLDSLLRGAYGFARGGEALARKFVDIIEKNGGTVHVRKRVSRIESEGKVARAVVTSEGERYEADWIISGIHPKPTFDLLSDPSALSAAFRSRVANIKESGGIFGLYGVCGESVKMDRRRNYYFLASNDPADLLSYRGPEDLPKTVFVSSASREGSGGMPLNIHAAAPIHWFKPGMDASANSVGDPKVLVERPEDYYQIKARYAEKMIEAVDSRMPRFKASFQVRSTSSSITNLEINGSPEGSAYGLYHSIANTGARALGPRTHVQGLLLTGQNCLFPGLLGAAVAGLRTAGHIIGIKPILRELKEMGSAV